MVPLGDVVKESAQAALSYIRSNAEQFHIPADFFDHHDIHIHIPAGAVPKDGPSAGLPIALALISLGVTPSLNATITRANVHLQELMVETVARHFPEITDSFLFIYTHNFDIIYTFPLGF